MSISRPSGLPGLRIHRSAGVRAGARTRTRRPSRAAPWRCLACDQRFLAPDDALRPQNMAAGGGDPCRPCWSWHRHRGDAHAGPRRVRRCAGRDLIRRRRALGADRTARRPLPHRACPPLDTARGREVSASAVSQLRGCRRRSHRCHVGCSANSPQRHRHAAELRLAARWLNQAAQPRAILRAWWSSAACTAAGSASNGMRYRPMWFNRAAALLNMDGVQGARQHRGQARRGRTPGARRPCRHRRRQAARQAAERKRR